MYLPARAGDAAGPVRRRAGSQNVPLGTSRPAPLLPDCCPPPSRLRPSDADAADVAADRQSRGPTLSPGSCHKNS
jgi:hypothetical protein